jgi:Type IV secretion system pilin
MMTSLLTKLFYIQPAHASGSTMSIDLKLFNPLKADQTIPQLISRIFTALVYLAAFIAPIFIIYGAFQMLTSAGNAEKFGTGKKTILYTVLGFLVVLGAKGIVEVVKTALTIK